MVGVLELRQGRHGDVLVALVHTTTRASEAVQLPSHGKPSYSLALSASRRDRGKPSCFQGSPGVGCSSSSFFSALALPNSSSLPLRGVVCR